MIAHAHQYAYDLVHGTDGYGFPSTITNAGTISMSIYLRNVMRNDNPMYSDAEYIGYTFSDVSDAMVIHYGEIDLKVVTVQPTTSRWTMVFLKRVNNGQH